MEKIEKYLEEYKAPSAEQKQRRQRTQKEITNSHQEQYVYNIHQMLSGLGEKFLKRTFETFEVSDDNKDAYEYFLNFAKDFKNQKKGIYLYGGYGSGKTHLAAAVANQLLSEGRRVLFLPVTSLKGRVYASYSDNSTAEFIENVCGKSFVTIWGAACCSRACGGRFGWRRVIKRCERCGKESLIPHNARLCEACRKDVQTEEKKLTTDIALYYMVLHGFTLKAAAQELRMSGQCLKRHLQKESEAALIQKLTAYYGEERQRRQARRAANTGGAKA